MWRCVVYRAVGKRASTVLKSTCYLLFFRGAVEFSVCMDLKNPWNDNKPVKISRDGQVG